MPVFFFVYVVTSQMITLSASSDDGKLALEVEKVKQGAKEDLAGLKLRVAYDNWPPFCIVHEDGSLGGISFEAMSFVGKQLNIEVEYVRNEEPGSFGSKDANGTWNGHLGMVVQGKVDLTIAGSLTE